MTEQWLESTFDPVKYSKEITSMVICCTLFFVHLCYVFLFQVKKKKGDLRGNLTGRLLLSLLKYYQIGASEGGVSPYFFLIDMP